MKPPQRDPTKPNAKFTVGMNSPRRRVMSDVVRITKVCFQKGRASKSHYRQ